MALFDENGKVVDPEALRSIQFNGAGLTVPRTRIIDGKKVVETLDPETGRSDGHITQHGDGRQDCQVNLKALHVESTSTL